MFDSSRRGHRSGASLLRMQKVKGWLVLPLMHVVGREPAYV
ncbi:hypothetical protein JOE21_002070 [Desmospora profundinema]|uniref:Uncharacterized protein n=1 Tax=Desmospora profundinema TaxID=1571184 RepID=A0ABU1IQ53_9BACL|nr:hypothetical protein [Desmospora profundinema]